MPRGICYEGCNDYITKKLRKFAKQSEVQYSIFGHYIVLEKDLDFKKFKFIPKSYYLKKIGWTDVNRWMNNEFKIEADYNSEIIKYRFKIKKSKNNNIVLYIADKRYKMEYTLHALRYFYRKLDKEFFEKDYNLTYMENKNMVENEIFSNVLDVDDVEQVENKFDEINEEQEYLSSHYRKVTSIDILRVFDGENFNFNVFYNNYFNKLTENQQKIVALYLLGIRITDISRFLNTTQVYITLEVDRLAKKIKKIYNKSKIEFCGGRDKNDCDN